MKAHIGVDAYSGLVRSLHTTAANESDVEHAHEVLNGQEVATFLDADYTGVAKREEVVQAQAENRIRSDIEWNMAKRRADQGTGGCEGADSGSRRAPVPCAQEPVLSQEDALKGLAKNEVFGLANLVLAKRRFMAIQTVEMSALERGQRP